MQPLTKLKTGLLVTAIGVATLPAIATALGNGDVVGTDEAAIRAALEADGYTVQNIEREDDEIEVHATRDGQAYEVELSAETGAILEIELED